MAKVYLQEKLTFDTSPTAGSTNPVTSGGVKTALDSKANSSHAHSAATTSAAGFLSAADKTKLDGIATGANKTTIVNNLTTTTTGSALDASQGKVLNDAIAGKAAASHTHSNYVPTSRTVNGKALSANITLSASDIGAAPLASPVFTGTPKAPAAATDYTTYRLRNMALVSSAPSSAIGNGQLVGVYS